MVGFGLQVVVPATHWFSASTSAITGGVEKELTTSVGCLFLLPEADGEAAGAF